MRGREAGRVGAGSGEGAGDGERGGVERVKRGRGGG